MSIRSVIGAAVVAVGMGSAAEAATFTTKTYDFFVRYEGTAFYSVDYYSLPDIETIFEGEDIEAGNTSLGLNSQLFGIPAIGTIFQFALQVVHPDVPFYVPYYGNGGTTPVCQLGPWDCTSTDQTSLSAGRITLSYDDDWWMSFTPEVGASIDVWLSTMFSPYPPGQVTQDGNHMYFYDDERSRFTILAVSEPAPVPLPATAALLPIGIGALALMRRRRRQVN